MHRKIWIGLAVGIWSAVAWGAMDVDLISLPATVPSIAVTTKSTAPLKLVSTIKLRSSNQPSRFIVDGPATRAYVFTEGDVPGHSTLEKINLESGEVEKTVSDLPAGGQIIELPDQNPIAFCASGEIRIYSAASLEVVRTIKAAPYGPNMVYDPASRQLFVTGLGADEPGILKIDPATGQNQGVISKSLFVTHLVPNTTAKRLIGWDWFRGGLISIIDPENPDEPRGIAQVKGLNLKAAVDVRSQLLFIAFEQGEPTRWELSAIDLSRRRLAFNYSQPGEDKPFSLAVDEKERKLYFTHGGGMIDIIDYSNLDAATMKFSVSGDKNAFIHQCAWITYKSELFILLNDHGQRELRIYLTGMLNG